MLTCIGLGGCLLCQELITVRQQNLVFGAQAQQPVIIVQAPQQQQYGQAPRECRPARRGIAER